MVNFARIQNRIYKGYEKAAIRLGTAHTVYRAPNAIDPVQEDNLLSTLLISIDQNFLYKKPKNYGDPIWQFLPQDGLSLQDDDIFISPGGTVYFIADIKPDDRLSPPLCVECNHTVSITRPTQPVGKGKVGYGGYDPTTATLLARGLPASILEGRIESNPLKLPLDTRSPSYKIILPELPGLEIRISDMIEDDRGVRLAVTSVELSGLGWRLMAVSIEA